MVLPESRPSRARGLKPRIGNLFTDGMESRPSRARGLKLGYADRAAIEVFEVAPFAGAWIETAAEGLKKKPVQQVAPFAGAWIETPEDVDDYEKAASRPSRARGLKHVRCQSQSSALCRALRGRVD
uniref:Uncharacterized protein n=1 Tax=Chlorobium chlorochromatii (strain CaD3) TaxID=340177 RepID=Q3ARW0_CHLCH